MVFSDPIYFVYFLLVLAGVVCLPTRAQIMFLIVASYIFYASWNPPFALLLVASTVLDYHLGIAIGDSQDQKRRKLYLIISLCFNLGMLGWFKYAHFAWSAAGQVVQVFGVTLPGWPFHVILPLGISFYTFITLSYVIDVYYGMIQPCRSLTKYGFFISFFPHLLAGPILRGAELLPQIDQPKKVGYEEIREGLGLLFRGYVKKACVADTIGIMLVDPVYAHPERYGTLTFWLAMIGFALQIYADFSGYTDMGRGSARLLGYNLPLNFRNPFLAGNPQEFWQRWHISLSRWLRDYVFYFAFGGFRATGLKLLSGVMATMTLAGLWHGATWPLILWGIYHGVWLVLHFMYRQAMKKYFGWDRWNKNMAYVWLSRFVMFMGFAFGQILGRAETMPEAMAIVRGIMGQVAGPGQILSGQVFLLMAAILIAHTWPLWPERIRSLRGCPMFVRDASYATVIIYIMVTLIGGAKAFIYFQF